MGESFINSLRLTEVNHENGDPNELGSVCSCSLEGSLEAVTKLLSVHLCYFFCRYAESEYAFFVLEDTTFLSCAGLFRTAAIFVFFTEYTFHDKS